MYDTILVPIDGSDGANRAIEHGLELAERFDAALYAIFVVDTRLYGEPGLSSTELVIDEIEDTGHGYLTDFAERADNHGIEIETRSCHGVPQEEIVTYADEVDADAIVMGYQGQTHEGRGQIGSVVDRVLQDATRPVFAV
ncbi:universal stress protein [Halorientalis halophila]|uniref:universal stress protein n=1 Tax=Halorientalis halophila TaxID=3108499 RepID=UPI00300AB7D9